ncbi:hypothetical protein [Poriferisphaera sp. WC338]|uniref:hypothetical protein n=1 Tax=Poriferisphaera sp. WC338 TaxID=3425129 RepID=UPI003D8150AF
MGFHENHCHHESFWRGLVCGKLNVWMLLMLTLSWSLVVMSGLILRFMLRDPVAWYDLCLHEWILGAICVWFVPCLVLWILNKRYFYVGCGVMTTIGVLAFQWCFKEYIEHHTMFDVKGIYEDTYGFARIAFPFTLILGSWTCVLWWATRKRMVNQPIVGKDVSCPECGYNLRGRKDTTCPECGATPTLEELVRGQSMAMEKVGRN